MRRCCGAASPIRRRGTGIDAIAAAARRGESLTRQLLTFSRRQPLSPVVIDLKQRIEAVRDMLGSSLRGNIALAVDIPDDIWPVEVDVAEFELALVNIAVNARDAMPEGGTFTMTARNVPASAAPQDQPVCRRLRRAVTQRHRHRHSAGRDREDLRSVLHHQGGRQGHRPRPVAGLRICPPVGRRRHRDQRGRSRHHLHACACRAARGRRRRLRIRRRREEAGAGRGHDPGRRRQSGGRRRHRRRCSSSSATRCCAPRTRPTRSLRWAAGRRSISCSATSSCRTA